jgi:hypothetical protein
MFASPLYHRKPITGKAPSPFLKYLSPSTVAFVLFIAVALLSSIGGKVNAFRDAFNDPALIEYANQLSTGIPDSSTTPLLSNSSQQSPCSKSPSSQSRTSSVSGY